MKKKSLRHAAAAKAVKDTSRRGFASIDKETVRARARAGAAKRWSKHKGAAPRRDKTPKHLRPAQWNAPIFCPFTGLPIRLLSSDFPRNTLAAVSQDGPVIHYIHVAEWVLERFKKLGFDVSDGININIRAMVELAGIPGSVVVALTSGTYWFVPPEER